MSAVKWGTRVLGGVVYQLWSGQGLGHMASGSKEVMVGKDDIPESGEKLR